MPRSDVLVFLTCFLLAVALDMVIAITTGILLAAMSFMREMARMTKVTGITGSKRLAEADLPAGRQVFKINGPLFSPRLLVFLVRWPRCPPVSGA